MSASDRSAGDVRDTGLHRGAAAIFGSGSASPVLLAQMPEVGHVS